MWTKKQTVVFLSRATMCCLVAYFATVCFPPVDIDIHIKYCIYVFTSLKSLVCIQYSGLVPVYQLTQVTNEKVTVLLSLLYIPFYFILHLPTNCNVVLDNKDKKHSQDTLTYIFLFVIIIIYFIFFLHEQTLLV